MLGAGTSKAENSLVQEQRPVQTHDNSHLTIKNSLVMSRHVCTVLKVEIIDNPKYKMSAGMGVCQLEIRRPRLGDAGTYTCLASNQHGEASCESTVIVREPK